MLNKKEGAKNENNKDCYRKFNIINFSVNCFSYFISEYWLMCYI